MRRISDVRGSALILNLIVLAIFAMLGVVVYRISRFQVIETVYQERLTQAHYIAEAGLEDALHSLYLDSSWRAGFSKKAFGGGYYTVTVSTDATPTITSTGYSQNIAFFGRAVKTVSAVSANYSSGKIVYAALGSIYWVVNAGAVVDAYNPGVNLNPSTFSFGVILWSNHDITTQSGAKVYGNVYYVKNASVANGTVLGTVNISTYTISLPTYDGKAYKTTNDNLTGITPASCYNAGTSNFNVPSGSTCTIKPGNYYFNQFVVNGTLNADTTGGPITVYYTGSFNTGGGQCAVNNLSKIPSRLLLYGQGSGSNHTLYCPAAPMHAYLVHDSGNYFVRSVLFGHAIGNHVTIDTGGVLHADTISLQGSTSSHITWNAGTWTQNYKRQ